MGEAGTAATAGTPDIAVIVAAWNAAATIERAVESALAQVDVALEVIVVDDASTDDTAARAQALAQIDPRVRVLRQPVNGGPAEARNRAIAESAAQWLTVLDADDFMDPGRLAQLLRIAREENADFVADDLLKVDEADPGGPRRRMWSDAQVGRMQVDAASFITGNLSARYGGRREMGFLKPLMSRSFLDRHGLSYDPAIRLGEDYVLYARALIAGARFVLTDPAGYVAVVRPSSLSGRHPTESHKTLIDADLAMLAQPGLDEATRSALHAHLMEQRKKWAWRRLIDAKGAGDARAVAACFMAPPAVIADLARRLGGEAMTRTRRRIGLR